MQASEKGGNLNGVIRERRVFSMIDFASDPILKKWINTKYLDQKNIEKLRDDCRSKPHVKYLVLDEIFRPEILDEYFKKHKQLPFKPDDIGKPDDSLVVFGSPNEIGGELFFHAPWQLLVSQLCGTEIKKAGKETAVKLRKHVGDLKGFWIHTDRAVSNPAKIASLVYLNKNWTAADGSLFQIWQALSTERGGRIKLVEVDYEKALRGILEQGRKISEFQGISTLGDLKADFKWDDLKGKQLDVLNEEKIFPADISAMLGIESHQMILLDQIIPTYNRMVLIEFTENPAYHSITPSSGRERYAIVQWYY